MFDNEASGLDAAHQEGGHDCDRACPPGDQDEAEQTAAPEPQVPADPIEVCRPSGSPTTVLRRRLAAERKWL